MVFRLIIHTFELIFNSSNLYALKTLLNQYLRFIITSLGISLCLILMLFLLAIYNGVSDASVRYVRESDAECLDRFGVGHLLHEFPRTLSQGEKQRVAVARAIANGAQLIIADEPTGSLATLQGMMIVEFLHNSVKKDGLSSSYCQS